MSSSANMPKVNVEAPRTRPGRNGLLDPRPDAARVIDTDDRIAGGTQWLEMGCMTDSASWDVDCPPAEPAWPHNKVACVQTSAAFHVGSDVWARATCSIQEIAEGLAAGFTTAQERAIEARAWTEFWGYPPRILPGPLPPHRAIAALSAAYARVGDGTVGLIHLPLEAAIVAAAQQAFDRTSMTSWVRGDVIVAGAGYGLNDGLPDGQAWAVITGGVTVRRAPVQQVEVIQTFSNQFAERVERVVTVEVGGCDMFAVLVDLTACCGG